MLINRPKTQILVDGGDPKETLRIKNLIGFVDGQTTNPSLIAKSPEIQQLVASGHSLSSEEEKSEYKKIVQSISPLVGDAGVSIEVFADLNTTAEEMLAQGQEMFSWIPNAYIKYPCTHEGLRAAQISIQRSIRVNMTLCFSQEQAAAVHAATKGSKEPVYVSPFVGRLDDRGEDGMDLVRNIKKMYEHSDGHVHVLAASIRNLNHLLFSFALRAELATVSTKVLEEWAAFMVIALYPGILSLLGLIRADGFVQAYDTQVAVEKGCQLILAQAVKHETLAVRQNYGPGLAERVTTV